MAKFYVEKILTNTKGQDGSTIAVYSHEDEATALKNAKVAYHQTLAAYENAEDVLLASVKIKNVYGVDVPVSNIVDHTPAPSES